MATYVPYNCVIITNEQFTEPCMNCFASVTYQRSEAVDHPQVTGGKCIICPSCGKVMSVHFHNVRLC